MPENFPKDEDIPKAQSNVSFELVPIPPSSFTIMLASVAIFLALSTGCTKPPQPEPAVAEAPKVTGLESIPAPDPAKYPPFNNMAGWKNPYLVVREDGFGIVDLSSHEVHTLMPEEIPAELAALPSEAWPYGRVVMVAQAMPTNPSDQAKTNLRKNHAELMNELKQLSVEVREAP